eukprot:scaffold48348_cov21-Tisochrysis_lutea.AAC.1
MSVLKKLCNNPGADYWLQAIVCGNKFQYKICLSYVLRLQTVWQSISFWGDPLLANTILAIQSLLLGSPLTVCSTLPAGWGAFLHDGAKKGDFIGEYTGDLITQ